MPRLDDDDALSLRVRRQATLHTPPPALAEGIAQRLRAEAEAAPAPTSARAVPARTWRLTWRRLSRWPRWLQGAALFAAGAATAGGLLLLVRPAAPTEDLVAAVTAGHVRSLMAEHLADVRSSDRHTVKPWFAGKLDYAPPVVDLASEGIPLIGGRLDYLGGRAVAALAYRAGAHVVNLFVWPAAGADVPPQAATRQGWHIVHWTQDGMQAWAVSDASEAELASFVARCRARWAAPAATP